MAFVFGPDCGQKARAHCNFCMGDWFPFVQWAYIMREGKEGRVLLEQHSFGVLGISAVDCGHCRLAWEFLCWRLSVLFSGSG